MSVNSRPIAGSPEFLATLTVVGQTAGAHAASTSDLERTCPATIFLADI